MDATEMYDVVLSAITTWREARGESRQTRIAVLHVIKTRADIGGWWGSSPAACCIQPWQFSSMTDPHDPQLVKWPHTDDPVFWECLHDAMGVFNGEIENPIPDADSYHDTSIECPKAWGTPELLGQLDSILFYKVRT